MGARQTFDMRDDAEGLNGGGGHEVVFGGGDKGV